MDQIQRETGLALAFGKLPVHRAGTDEEPHELKALLEMCSTRDPGASEEGGANCSVAEKSLREGRASEMQL